jgi:uncharacterized protein
MIKILVVSDSHGNFSILDKILEENKPFDYLIHCGDGVDDLSNLYIESKIIKVSGNVDLYRGIDIVRVNLISIEDKKILVVHGDLLGVKNGYESLRSESIRVGADITLFGHSHIQYLSDHKPYLFNPGAAIDGFYGIIEIGNTIKFIHNRFYS